MAIWGIDLGGTKIEGVVLADSEDLKIICRQRIDTEASKGYEHILDRIRLLVDQIAKEVGDRPKKIGIGTPGATDPSTGRLKNSNTTVLNGKPFKSDLEQHLGVEIVMANDANCFALAESIVGIVKEKAPEAKLIFGVIMGTGVGGGIVINGKVWNGRHGIAGEWGHNFLDQSGGQCYCGKVGCVEKVLSGKNLELYHKEKYGEDKKLKQIYTEHLQGGNPNSTATIKRLIYYFGKGMAQVINTLDPDVIVLGGGVGSIDLLYTEGVEAVGNYIFNDKVSTAFLRPKLGDSAGVFGAAFLVKD
ncbi:MAG: ROK family protein [Cyclobacteriaceae bacterium]